MRTAPAVLCVLALAAQGRAAPAPVSFRVDVRGPDGAAVAGADVRAFAIAPRDPIARSHGRAWWPGDAPPPAASATCDARGRADVGALATGRYHLVVAARGLATACVESAWADGPTPRSVTVSLARGASLFGFVRDADGRPLAGWTVAAAPEASSWGPQPAGLARRTVTNEDGAYALEGLAPQRCEVSVRDPAERWATHDLVAIPQVARHDVAVSAPGFLRGRVLDAQTKARLVTATLEFLDSKWLRVAHVVARADCAADGTYTAASYRPWTGIEAVRITAPGQATLHTEFDGRLSPDAPIVRDFALEPESRVEGQVAGPGGPVAGARVLVSWRTPGPFDEIDTATTTTDARGAFALGGLPAGEIGIRVLAPGLVAEGTDLGADDRGPMRRSMQLEAQRMTDLPAAWRARVGRGATLVRDVRMLPSPDPVLAEAAFAGRVVLADGAPAAWARVVLAGSGERHQFRPELAETIAGADGRFALRALGEPRSWSISAQLPGWGRVRTHPFPSGGESVAPGEDLVVRLTRTPGVRGRAVSRTGLPLAGARVHVGAQHGASNRGDATYWDDHPRGVVAADGAFEVFLAALPGWGSDSDTPREGLVVCVEADGHAAGLSAPFTRADLAKGLVPEVALDAGATLSGRVSWSGTDAPAAHVAIRLSPDGGQWNDRSFPPRYPPFPPRVVVAVTDDDGLWSVPHLVPGAHTVEIDVRGACVEATKVDAAGTTRHDVALAAATDVAGVLVRPDGRPVAGGRVTLRPWDAPPSDAARAEVSTETADDGSFRFRRVRRIAYALEAEPPAGAPRRSARQRVDGVTTGLRVVLR